MYSFTISLEIQTVTNFPINGLTFCFLLATKQTLLFSLSQQQQQQGQQKALSSIITLQCAMNNYTTQPPLTSAFPYTVPFTNPYTQKKSTTQPSSPYNNHHNDPSNYHNAPQQELEQALSVLARSSNVPSTQNIESLFELVRKANEQTRINGNHASSTTCWTLSMAEHLATFIVRLFACHNSINMTGRNPEGYPSTLCFLSRCLEEWACHEGGDDCGSMLLYAVAVQPMEVELREQTKNNTGQHQIRYNSTRTIQRSLLEVLHHLVVHFQDPIVQLPAMAGLGTIWRYMDRVQLLTRWNSSGGCDSNSFSLDTVWWMPVADESGIARLALGELLKEDKEDAYPKVYIFPDRKELHMASATLLTCFLKHDRIAWLQELTLEQNKGSLRKLSQNLLEDAHRLADSSVTSSQGLHQSIASASLLCLMDSKETLEHTNEFNQLVYSTKLLDSVFRSCFGIFGASSPSGPRWSFENKDSATLQWMEDFIFNWSLAKDGSTRKLAIDAQERYWRGPIEQYWGSLLKEDYSQPGEWSQNMKRCRAIFSRLVLLTTVHHSSLHRLLNNILTQAVRNQHQSVDALVQPCQRILQSLQHLTLHVSLSC